MSYIQSFYTHPEPVQMEVDEVLQMKCMHPSGVDTGVSIELDGYIRKVMLPVVVVRSLISTSDLETFAVHRTAQGSHVLSWKVQGRAYHLHTMLD